MASRCWPTAKADRTSARHDVDGALPTPCYDSRARNRRHKAALTSSSQPAEQCADARNHELHGALGLATPAAVGAFSTRRGQPAAHWHWSSAGLGHGWLVRQRVLYVADLALRALPLPLTSAGHIPFQGGVQSVMMLGETPRTTFTNLPKHSIKCLPSRKCDSASISGSHRRPSARFTSVD